MDTVEHNNQTLIISVASLLLAICFITFALRLWARKVVKVKLGADDWSMIAVLAICAAMSTSDFVGIRFGSGVHSDQLPPSDVYNFQINLFIFMLLWTAGTTCVRVSILLFYWRVFTVRGFRRAVLATGSIVVFAGTVFFFIFAFQCSPPSHFWNVVSGGSCIDQTTYYIAAGSINLLEDVIVLVLPMPVLWRLKATVPRKIALSFIFALGGFVCVTSIIRLVAIKKVDPADFTWSNVQGGVWSTIEVEVGCICANLVHLRPIMIQWSGLFRTRTPSGQGNSLESEWPKRRGEGFSEIADSPTRGEIVIVNGTGSDVELDSQSNAGIIVHTELTQDVERRLPEADDDGKGQLTTNVYGFR